MLREQKNKLIQTKTQPQAQILTSSGLGIPSIWSQSMRPAAGGPPLPPSHMSGPQVAAPNYQENWEAKNKRMFEHIYSQMQEFQQRPDIKLGNCSTKVSEKSEWVR